MSNVEVKWMDVSEQELENYKGVTEELKETKSLIKRLKRAGDLIGICLTNTMKVFENRTLINRVLADLDEQCWRYEEIHKENRRSCRECGHVGKWESRKRDGGNHYNVLDGEFHITYVWKERRCIRCGFKEKTPEKKVYD